MSKSIFVVTETIDNSLADDNTTSMTNVWENYYASQKEAWDAIFDYMEQSVGYDGRRELQLYDQSNDYENWPAHSFVNGYEFHVTKFIV